VPQILDPLAQARLVGAVPGESVAEAEEGGYQGIGF
jgi:hypothetical protein